MFRTSVLSHFLNLLVFILSTSFYLSAEAQQAGPRANPEISINALFLGTVATDGHEEHANPANGFSMQEVEFRFTSNVDPYFRGEFTLAVHPEHERHEGEPEEEGHEEEGGALVIDLEEAFIETISLTDVSIRAGKFFAYLGRHNQLHTHYFPFIDAPLPHSGVLGEHGLNETGVAVSYLAPTPWYTELALQVFSGDNEELFNSHDPGGVAGLTYLKTLWETSDASTLELNLGYGSGANSYDGTTDLYNAAITWKWRPMAQTIYRSFSWTTEYLQAELGGADEVEKKAGITTWVEYQFARRWWAQARAEQLQAFSAAEVDTITRYSALVGLVPSEYSSLRLQVDQIHDSHHGEDEQRVSLQWNIAIGAHPAHLY